MNSQIAAPMTDIATAEDASATNITVGSADRTAHIIRAANELLEQEGLEGLTIRAVLLRTGLARRALYERFSGKDELVLAVFKDAIANAATRLGAITREMAGPLERLELIVKSIVIGRPMMMSSEFESGARLSAALSREHLRLGESHPEELQAALAPLIALIAAQLDEGMERGLVRRTSAHRLANLVYNLVSTTVHAELIGKDPKQSATHPRQDLAADIWTFCRNAIIA